MDRLVVNKGVIAGFGEVLLRLCPDLNGNWLTKNNLPVYSAGAELNALTALSLWGLPTRYFTALPDNNLSAQVVNHIRQQNIDTGFIHYQGSRMGLYFLTPGQDLKHDGLIYDRAHSAFAELKPGMIDWDKALEGVSWFHFSAISPAVSASAAEVCKGALEAASAKNITISVDLNYRSRLWHYGKSPVEIMPGLAQYCDVIMGNIWSVEKMLGISIGTEINENTTKQDYLDIARQTSQNIAKHYPNCKAVANTFRFDATDINYYSTLYTDNQFYHSAEYNTPSIINKVGSGDCFMAGLIYGFYNALPPEETLAYATAAAFGKLFVKSDTTDKTVDEIKKSIKR